MRVFLSQKCCADSLVGVPNTRAYTAARIRMITYACYRSCCPCQSSLEYGNTKRPSAHFIINKGWVERLCCSWLSLGKATRISPPGKMPLGQQSVQIQNTKDIIRIYRPSHLFYLASALEEKTKSRYAGHGTLTAACKLC